jgi:valyl-tRNA synthetase
MSMPKTYTPGEMEPRLEAMWQAEGIYLFDRQADTPVFSIDTPPATVSGNLHLGHCYSYSQPDFMARYFRMQGFNVFYPMGFDDNGLPTERLVEKRLKIHAASIERQKFVDACLKMGEEVEKDYRALWQRLGLSIDWRFTYRTIAELSQRTAQLSFIEAYRGGLAGRKSAPAIWCPECQTAIAQAELNDLERQSEFVTLAFKVSDGSLLRVATTRPELLAACVAVFVHPQDARYQGLVGQTATVPLYNQAVPILADPAADPAKGTGAVMCCTFGDQADVAWWHIHQLSLVEAIDRQGRMTTAAGEFAGLPLEEARHQIKARLAESDLILDRQATSQSIRVHERCDTPVEYIVTPQWFINVLAQRAEYLQAGAKVAWYPEHMQARYQSWVENLSWDWCISRQRFFGVPFPVWYCQDCGEVILAGQDELPVDPASQLPTHACPGCGGTRFVPDEDKMDTWATSSLSPQIVGGWLSDPDLYHKVFPFSLRPQAHEIIRTWAFYTIAKSLFHFGQIPWKNVLISGWGIAGEGMGKISKSRGGGPMPPMEMIQRHSADAVRYWAASTGPGRDAIISEEKIQMGSKLVTKLWNVGRFSEPFIARETPVEDPHALTPADRWILSRLQGLIRRATQDMQQYEYASAKSEIESFFWKELADNYLEMAKSRLYSSGAPGHGGATYTLYTVQLNVLKLLAPFLPFVTDALFRELYASAESVVSIHRSQWPAPQPRFENSEAEKFGEALVAVATAIRRYKSEHNLSLGTELNKVQLAPNSADLAGSFVEATIDLMSVSRARQVEVSASLPPGLIELPIEDVPVKIGIEI